MKLSDYISKAEKKKWQDPTYAKRRIQMIREWLKDPEMREIAKGIKVFSGS